MTLYVDTSVLAAYYCPEPASKKAQTLLASHPGPAISWLTGVELLSALSRKVRERTLGRHDAARIVKTFRDHIADGYYSVLPLENIDYETAQERIGRFDNTLRTLDALHLAVATRCGGRLATADRAMAAAAEESGVKAILVGVS